MSDSESVSSASSDGYSKKRKAEKKISKNKLADTKQNEEVKSKKSKIKKESVADSDEEEMETKLKEEEEEQAAKNLISKIRTQSTQKVAKNEDQSVNNVNLDEEEKSDENMDGFALDLEVDPELLRLMDDANEREATIQDAENTKADEDDEDEEDNAMEDGDDEEPVKQNEDALQEEKLVMDVRIGNVIKMDETTADVNSVAFHPLVQKFLEKLKIVELFPVQRTVIPFVMNCEQLGIDADICIGCPTGSGKTLSYLLPIFNTLVSNFVSGRWRALIIVPTINLTQQVTKICESFERLKIGSLCGAIPFLQEVASIVKDGKVVTDIIVATPGSLLNHLRNNKYITMKDLQFIVMDEVDRLLEPDTVPLMQQILRNYYDSSFYAERLKFDREFHQQFAAPKPFRAARKILCSATMTQNPGKLELVRVTKPQFFTYLTTSTLVSASAGEMSHLQGKKYTVPTHLYQHGLIYRSQYKPLYLFQFLKSLDAKSSVLLFSKSKKTIKRLQLFFNEFKASMELKVAAITKRDASSLIRAFNQGKIQVLICTDSMARGIDLPAVDYVINYELPSQLKTYVHRIGRTARANQEFGDAVTMCSTKEELQQLEALLKEKTNTQHLNCVEFDFKDLMIQYRTPYIHALQSLQKILSK